MSGGIQRRKAAACRLSRPAAAFADRHIDGNVWSPPANARRARYAADFDGPGQDAFDERRRVRGGSAVPSASIVRTSCG